MVGIEKKMTYNILSFQDLIVVRKKGRSTIGYNFNAKATPKDKLEVLSLFLYKNNIESKLKSTTTES